MKFTAHESFKTQVYFVSQGQELTMLDQEEEEYVRGVLSFEGKKEQILSLIHISEPTRRS